MPGLNERGSAKQGKEDVMTMTEENRAIARILHAAADAVDDTSMPASEAIRRIAGPDSDAEGVYYCYVAWNEAADVYVWERTAGAARMVRALRAAARAIEAPPRGNLTVPV
jgi:hypothetical protein